MNQSPSAGVATTPFSMELISLDGSPYSRRIRWALQLLLNVDYTKTEYESIAGEPSLRWRLGRYNLCKSVTVPVAFISTKTTTTDKETKKNNEQQQILQLENGFDIVEWADDFNAADDFASTTTTSDVTGSEEKEKKDNNNNNNKTNIRLVPPSLRNEVVEYCNIADEIQNFGRAVFVDAVKEDPSLLRIFLGNDSPPDSVLPVVGFIISSFMTIKYRSTFHQKSIMEMKDLLTELQSHIEAKKKKNMPVDDDVVVYSVGNSLTLADLYLCVAIYDGQPGKDKDKDDDASRVRYQKLKEATTRHSFDIETEFPILYEWAKTIRIKHGGVEKTI